MYLESLLSPNYDSKSVAVKSYQTPCTFLKTEGKISLRKQKIYGKYFILFPLTALQKLGNQASWSTRSLVQF